MYIKVRLVGTCWRDYQLYLDDDTNLSEITEAEIVDQGQLTSEHMEVSECQVLSIAPGPPGAQRLYDWMFTGSVHISKIVPAPTRADAWRAIRAMDIRNWEMENGIDDLDLREDLMDEVPEGDDDSGDDEEHPEEGN